MYEQTEIPEYLKKKIDANHAEPNCYLKINELCLATFRDGTNLQEIAVPHKAEYRAQQRGIVDKEEIKAIARDILTQQNQLNNLMTQYINTVFTAPKHKLNEPFVYLKYKSADIELKTKTLVMYPKIVSEKLFSDYQKFLQNNGLKDCGVDMSKNNLVFDAVQTGINHFMRQEKRGPPENKRRNIETHIMER